MYTLSSGGGSTNSTSPVTTTAGCGATKRTRGPSIVQPPQRSEIKPLTAQTATTTVDFMMAPPFQLNRDSP